MYLALVSRYAVLRNYYTLFRRGQYSTGVGASIGFATPTASCATGGTTLPPLSRQPPPSSRGSSKSKLSAADDIGIGLGAIVIVMIICIVGAFILYERSSGSGKARGTSGRPSSNPVYHASSSTNDHDGYLLVEGDY